MFVFELKLVNAECHRSVTINEFQLATLLRILKSRNKELYMSLNKYYEEVADNVSYSDLNLGRNHG